MTSGFKYDVCVVGGLGHVGLPLSIVFAERGLKTCAFDISKKSYDIVSKGKMPFIEEDGEETLKRAMANGNLHLSLSPESISESENIIITIGTPVDVHMHPEPTVEKFIEKHLDYLRDGQLLVLRSTVYPGTTEKIHKLLESKKKAVDVAFCPERIVQGYAIRELKELPQIVAGTTKPGEERATKLFGALTKDIVVLTPKEAELAKLFTNSWRYIRFAAANQFFYIANDAGVDFNKIYDALSRKYPRGGDMPGPGFASGPCLFKDTVQLNAFANRNFHIGNGAMQINEGAPAYVVSKMKQRYDLSKKNVGILGLAFKAESDDKRDSLSNKLVEMLRFEVNKLYYADPYVEDEGKIDAQELVDKCDIIVLATPHKQYKDLKIGPDKVLFDIWNFYGKGSKM